MKENMEQTLMNNLKTYITVCIAYMLIIILIISKPSVKKLNELSFGDFSSYIIPVLLSSCLSFVCYFLIDSDLHNAIDKLFGRREDVRKEYTNIINIEAKNLNYEITNFSYEDANFIFYYIADRQPELREIAFNYWNKIFSFDLYSLVSIVFFVIAFVMILLIRGFCWWLLLPIAYLFFFVVCQFFCIPKVYKKAKLLPQRQIRDFAISSEQDFIKLIIKIGFVYNEKDN